MAISDTIRDVKNSLEEIKRKYRFKKARMAREDAVELQVTLAKCRGKLEICKNDFNRVINIQSKNINEGKKVGADTIIQEQILWDAAIGYMLVRDAIYALETITSYDTVSHAYEMLDAAIKQAAGKKSTFTSGIKVSSTKERNAYGYITSTAALQAKEEQLNCFFEELKQLGNIEARLATARQPGAMQAEQRYAYSDNKGGASMEQSDVDQYMNRLNSLSDTPAVPVNIEQDLGDMMDIQPPKDSL